MRETIKYKTWEIEITRERDAQGKFIYSAWCCFDDGDLKYFDTRQKALDHAINLIDECEGK